jgi:gliding motility-associated-like protein
MFVRKNIVLLLIIIASNYPFRVNSQVAYVNTPLGIFELTGGIGNCATSPIINGCNEPSSIFSLALYKDTIYYNTGAGQLKRFKVGNPGSCEVLVNVGGHNSMTIDKNGIIYLTDTRLHRYNPYTNTLTTLGQMPFGSAGDLFYFNDKLLLAGSPAGIYEINIANPAASTLYMNTNGISFYGLISLPESCSDIRYYGLSPTVGGTNIVELDMANKTVLGTVCTLPMTVLDAASVTEGGINSGITVRSIDITQPCPPAIMGSVNVNTFSQADLTFTLDNGPSNTTGIFTGIPIGNHVIHIASSNGCTKDTTFKIAPGLSRAISVVKTNPDNCDNNNGTVSLTGTSIYMPLSFTWMGENRVQGFGEFTGIPSGQQTFRIEDAEGCTRDTIVDLIHQPKPFISSIDFQQAHCALNNGSVKVNVTDAATTNFTSLNNSPFVAGLEYTGLVPGTYYLQVKSGSSCYFDTTFIISNVDDAKPQITIQAQDQLCFTDNGRLTINISGNDAPYMVQINNGGFIEPGPVSNLAPGNYLLEIKNQFDCAWDSFAIIQPYQRVPYIADIKAVNPTCRGITNGSLKLTISGAQTPYTLQINGKPYENGKLIENLGEGEYNIQVRNADDCIMDILEQKLLIPFEAHCIDVYVPNAFTPNDDGKNDVLKPSYSSFIKDARIKIFNRHGQLMFEGRGNSAAWDGRYNGVMQPVTVYVYTLTYKDHLDQSRFLKGHVTLIR